LTVGLGTLVGIISSIFRSGELGKRNLVAPVRSRTLALQIAAGCGVAAVASVVWVALLSFIPVIDGLELIQSSPAAFGLLMGDVLVFTLVAVAIGFFLGQLGLRTAALNGAANILGLGMTFLSGAFGLVSAGLEGFTRCLPAYWYANALETVAMAGSITPAVMATYWTDLGIQALFAVAIGCVGLVVARLRSQTAEQGGNAAALVEEI
ncbi:MAG: ABC transporter permease, partial [Propionibacteriaceae bacterium]|nr:ABC transporter permease [Propionibacteriaceae bacterium]